MEGKEHSPRYIGPSAGTSIMATDTSEITHPLQGYRITSDYGIPSARLKVEGADVLRVYQAPQSDREAFLEWWTCEKERAVRDRVILVVVIRCVKYACHREWLQGIEEEEWFHNDDSLIGVRFTTLENLDKAIDDNESLTDDWGDIIEKMCTDSAGAIAPDDERHLADVVSIAEAISDSEEDSGEGSVIGASIRLLS